MIEEIKTLDERKAQLLELGKKQGYVTYEQLAVSIDLSLMAHSFSVPHKSII